MDSLEQIDYKFSIHMNDNAYHKKKCSKIYLTEYLCICWFLLKLKNETIVTLALNNRVFKNKIVLLFKTKYRHINYGLLHIVNIDHTSKFIVIRYTNYNVSELTNFKIILALCTIHKLC
jgi:hypothetical protein